EPGKGGAAEEEVPAHGERGRLQMDREDHDGDAEDGAAVPEGEAAAAPEPLGDGDGGDGRERRAADEQALAQSGVGAGAGHVVDEEGAHGDADADGEAAEDLGAEQQAQDAPLEGLGGAGRPGGGHGGSFRGSDRRGGRSGGRGERGGHRGGGLGVEPRGADADGLAAAQGVGAAGGHGVSGVAEREDGGGLVGHGDPQVEPGAAEDVDAVGGEGFAHRGLAFGVAPSGAGNEGGDVLVLPGREDEVLEDVRDPAVRDRRAPLHAGPGVAVGGDDGAAQVRAVGLGGGADEHPPFGGVGHEVERGPAQLGPVIVLDDEHARAGGDDLAEGRGARGGEGGAGGVLPARGEDERAGASGQGPVEFGRDGALGVHGDGRDLVSGGEQEVAAVAPGGLFDGDGVSGSAPRGEAALEGVERARGDGEFAVDAVGGEALAGAVEQVGAGAAAAVVPSADVDARFEGGEVGQELGVGFAADEIEDAGRDGDGAGGGEGGAFAHDGAGSAAGL